MTYIEMVDSQLNPDRADHPQFTEIVKEMEAQAANPPGKDTYMSNFYTAAVNLADSDLRISKLVRKPTF
jgi:hypothetical protein